MTDFGFLPELPLPASGLLLFGMLVLAGLAGGELARRLLAVPGITGFVAIGMLLGPSGFGFLSRELLGDSRLFMDIGLGLVLFEMGRRLDVRWLLRERWLLATGVLESLLAFAVIYFVLLRFAVPPLVAAVAAAIGMSTSPPVVILVARELRAEGQVTERTLSLSAIDSVIAFLVVTVMLSLIHVEYHASLATIVLHPLYLLLGSLALGLAASGLAMVFGRLLGKREELQLVLMVGLAVVTIGAARALGLSVLLALIAFGVLARNLDRRHYLMPVDIGRVGQLFFVILFVVSGANLEVKHLAYGSGLALAFVAARAAGKAAGVLALAPFGSVSLRKSAWLSLSLMPMGGLGVALAQDVTTYYPEFSALLTPILVAALVILELAGPLATQLAFKRCGEAAGEPAGEQSHG